MGQVDSTVTEVKRFFINKTVATKKLCKQIKKYVL